MRQAGWYIESVKNRLILTTLLLIAATLGAADFSDTYGDLSDMFGIDPNAGQNSFLTLRIPSGGRYQSMATAYTALAMDAGYLEANPAGATLLEQTQLTFHHNNWIADSNLETISFTSRRDRMGYGFSGKFLHLPFTAYNAWGASTATGYYTESIATFNIAYKLLGDYYYEGLSLGASVKTGYRGVSASLATGQSALSLMADVGLITRFNFLKFFDSRDRNFSFGVAARNMGTEFIDNPDPLPSQVSAGIAWRPLNPWTLSADFFYPFNMNGEPAERFYGAVGTDIAFTDFLAMQAGFLLKQGQPRFTLGSALDMPAFSLNVNYTLDLTTQFVAFDRVSLSLKLNLGDFGRMDLREKVQLLYLEGLEAYTAGDMTLALDKWEECLALDPGFTPAVEMIETAERSRSLEREMRRQQGVSQ